MLQKNDLTLLYATIKTAVYFSNLNSKNMDNKSVLSSGLIPKFFAVFFGVIVFKQFDFATLQFKHLGLGLLYLAMFVISLYLVFKNNKDKNTGD